MGDFTLDELNRKKAELVAKEQEQHQVEAKIQVLAENIKSKYQVADVKSLKEKVESTKIASISAQEKYTVNCQAFREKWDV